MGRAKSIVPRGKSGGDRHDELLKLKVGGGQLLADSISSARTLAMMTKWAYAVWQSWSARPVCEEEKRKGEAPGERYGEALFGDLFIRQKTWS
jgi:hypothetical protein